MLEQKLLFGLFLVLTLEIWKRFFFPARRGPARFFYFFSRRGPARFSCQIRYYWYVPGRYCFLGVVFVPRFIYYSYPHNEISAELSGKFALGVYIYIFLGSVYILLTYVFLFAFLCFQSCVLGRLTGVVKMILFGKGYFPALNEAFISLWRVMAR